MILCCCLLQMDAVGPVARLQARSWPGTLSCWVLLPFTCRIQTFSSTAYFYTPSPGYLWLQSYSLNSSREALDNSHLPCPSPSHQFPAAALLPSTYVCTYWGPLLRHSSGKPKWMSPSLTNCAHLSTMHLVTVHRDPWSISLLDTSGP